MEFEVGSRIIKFSRVREDRTGKIEKNDGQGKGKFRRTQFFEPRLGGQFPPVPMNLVWMAGLPKPREQFPQNGRSLRETRTTPSLTLVCDRWNHSSSWEMGAENFPFRVWR
jgi:hypothetical protein